MHGMRRITLISSTRTRRHQDRTKARPKTLAHSAANPSRRTVCGSPGPRVIASRTHTRGFRAILRDVRNQRDWMVDDAVGCELLSDEVGLMTIRSFEHNLG